MSDLFQNADPLAPMAVLATGTVRTAEMEEAPFQDADPLADMLEAAARLQLQGHFREALELFRQAKKLRMETEAA